MNSAFHNGTRAEWIAMDCAVTCGNFFQKFGNYIAVAVIGTLNDGVPVENEVKHIYFHIAFMFLYS